MAAPRLLAWRELESWRQDNQYILASYRESSNSFKKSFHSLTYLHNETVNVYTHLLGAVAFSLVGVSLYYVLGSRYSSASLGDILAFACFFGGAALCLGMSGFYHLIMNHSQQISSFGNKLDYLGIVFLIAGSYAPMVYYGFYCYPDLRLKFWTMMSTTGLACATLSVYPKFRTPQWRPYRAAMFIAMGLSSVWSVFHGAELFGYKQLDKQMGLSWMITEGVLYITGALLYAARVPERLKPGAFDVLGSSHQIFHVLILLAAAAHLVGLVKAFDYRHQWITCDR